MKFLKYLLLIFIIFLTPNVFAAEFNMSNNTSATQGGSKGYYNALEIYNSGSLNRYKLNTRYNGQISTIETFFEYPFVGNTTYRFTYNMATEDFRNNFGTSYWWDCSQSMSSGNAHTLSVSYISYKKVQYSIKPSENTTCIKVELRSRSTSSVPITGISNWNLSSITLYDPDWQSGSGSGQGSATPSPSPSTNQDIINNQNNNTQDIINNQNDNTNSIIENNNNNTKQIIDSMSNCNKNFIPDDFVTHTDSGLTLTKNNDGSIHVEGIATSSTFINFFVIDNASIYFDNDVFANLDTVCGNKGYCITLPQNGGFTISNGVIWSFVTQGEIYNFTYYPMLTTSPFPSQFISPQQDLCTSKIDETTNAINQQNEYLMDNSDPNVSDNEFLSMFNSVGVNDPLSYLLTLPTQLINKIVSLSDSCSTINLGTLYGVMITLPCINLENILGSSVWNIVDVIFSVSLLVVIFKNLYDTFSNLLTMGAEKEAKEKFSMPTPMDFLSMILGGDR